MDGAEIRNYLARTAADSEAVIAGLRRKFAPAAGQLIAAFAQKGAYGGSAFRETMHNVCAEELRARIATMYVSALECTVGAHAPPDDALRAAVKNWIADAATVEADDLAHFLWKPRADFGEVGQPDTLIDDARRERAAILARIDNAFDGVQRSHAEGREIKIGLEPEQRHLLADLVEADRRLPREQRDGFLADRTIASTGVDLMHPGWIDDGRTVSENDLHELVSCGALRQRVLPTGVSRYWITSEGLAMYAQNKRDTGAPAARVEKVVREYFDAPAFRARHAIAYAKWSQAEAKLWNADAEQSLTVIGHLCREAMREFATSLLETANVQDAPSDPSRTIERLRAVIRSRNARRGDTDTAFDDALLVYWGTMSDLVQRQEHGSQREGRPLTWGDARRVVVHLMVVMYEIDSAMH